MTNESSAETARPTKKPTKIFNVQQLKDYYLLTLMQEQFHHHLQVIKAFAEKRKCPQNPICHISYAWPVLEAEAELQYKLLILEEDIELAGVNPNLDLQDVCSPEFKEKHPDSAPDYQDLLAFRNTGITAGNTVFMIGTESYQTQTSDKHAYAYQEEQQIRSLFLDKQLTVIPMLYSGDFPKSFPKGANYTAGIGFKFSAQEDYLRDLPNALAHLHGIGQDPEFTVLRRTFESILKEKEKSITDEEIAARRDSLTQQLAQREDKYQNRVKIRLARFSLEQREQLDGHLIHLEYQTRQVLLQQAQALAINQKDSPLNQALGNADTTALLGELAMDGEGQVLWQSTPVNGHWESLLSSESSKTAWVLCGLPSGKRDWLKIQERTLWQVWQKAQEKAIQEPSLENRRTARATPLPVYIDLGNTKQITDPYNHLIEQGLASLHISSAEIDWMRQGQQLFLFIDGFERIAGEINLAARNGFYQWHVKVLYTCSQDYLTDTPHRALYFAPTDANQQPLPEQLAFIDVSHPQRKNSIAADLDQRSRIDQEDTTTQNAPLKSSATEDVKPGEEKRSDTAEEQAYWQTRARLMLQREAYTDPLHALLRQFQTLAHEQGTAINQAFISYAWPDGRTEAGRMACTKLQGRLQRIVADSSQLGIRVILDIEQLAPGINVETFMDRELANSQAVFLIGTPRLKARIAESWEKDGVIQHTNAYFEFERILKKHESRPTNTHSPIYLLLFEGENKEVSFPNELPPENISLFPFSDETDYFLGFAELAMTLLQLNNHPKAKELLADYQEAYAQQESSFTPDVLQNKVEAAKAQAKEQADAQRKAFENLSEQMGEEALQSLMASEADALAQTIEDYKTKADVCKPDSYIGQTLTTYIPIHYSKSPQFTEPGDGFSYIARQIETWQKDKSIVPSADKITSTEKTNATPPVSFLILEGGSGGGKSLFLNYLERHYLQSYHKGQPIPVLIRLSKSDDPNHNLVEQELNAQGYSSALIASIQKNKTPLLILLDGFDELPLSKLDPKITLYEQNNLHAWNAYVILSCRSQQLPVIERHLQTTIDQYWRRGEHAPKTDHLFITPFDEEQIQAYVTHYVNVHPGRWTTKDYLHRLKTIPGLDALVQNPFVLRLVCSALPTLVKGDTSALSRYSIYEAFTQQWFAKEQWRLISQEQLATGQAFIEALSDWCEDQAWQLLATQQTIMTLPETTDQIKRRAAPIRLLEDNQAQFIHKSVLEYFGAKHVVDALDAGLKDSLDLANTFSWVGQEGMLSFLVDSLTEARTQQLWAMIATSRNNKGDGQAASNAATTLNAAGIAFTGRDLSHTHLPGADLTNAIIDHVNLEGADLSNTNVSLAWLAFSNFKGTNLTGVRWGEQADWLGHRGAVNAVVLSPDKTTLASGGVDGDIRLWDAQTGLCKQILVGHKQKAAITCLDFSPDGRLLVSGGEDHGVRLWWVDTGRLVREFDKGARKDTDKKDYFTLEIVGIPNEAELIQALRRFSPKTYVLVEKQQIYSCYYRVSAHESTLVPLSYELTKLHYCPRDRLITERKDGFDALISTIADRVHRLRYGLSHKDMVTSVRFSRDGKTINSASRDGEVYGWDTGKNRIDRVFTLAEKGIVNTLTPSPMEPGYLAVGSNQSIHLFGATEKINRYHGTEGDVSSLTFHPNGQTLLSGSDQGAIYAWIVRENRSYDYSYLKAQPHSAERGQAYVGHKGVVTGLEYSQDAEWVLSTSQDHSIRLWQRESGQCMNVIEHARAPIHGFAVREEVGGRSVYTADGDGRVRQNILQSAQKTQAFRHSGPVRQLFASAGSDQSWMSLGSTGDVAWHTADGRSVISQQSLSKDTCLLASNANASLFIVATASGMIDAYRRADKQAAFQPTRLTRLPAPPSVLVCTSDGSELWMAVDAQLHRYTIVPFARKKTLSGHHATIHQIVLHDGECYTLGEDGALCIWSKDQDTPLWWRTAHKGAGTKLSVSRDWIATAGLDQQVILWDRASRQEKQRWTMPVNAGCAGQAIVVAFAFNQDGSQLAVLLQSRYVILYDTASGERLSSFMINASRPSSLGVRGDDVLVGDTQGHLQWWCWRGKEWHLHQRSQPQLLAQSSQLDQAKGLEKVDHQLLGQRFATGQTQAASRLLSLLLDSDLIGLEQHLNVYPESFHTPVFQTAHNLIDYVLTQGPTDVLPLLLRLSPKASLEALVQRHTVFDALIRGNLKTQEAAQAMVSLLALQDRGYFPHLPTLGPYNLPEVRQRCDEVLQLALKQAIQTQTIVAITALRHWSASLTAPIVNRLALYEAVTTGNASLIDRFLQAGARLTDTDEQGESALFWAIRQHQYALAKIWLMPEQVTQRNYQGATPVHLMAEQGWLEGLYGLSPDQLTIVDNHGKTPLHDAAAKGHLPVVDYYQNKSIALDTPDADGHTPLWHAVKHNRLHVVQRLVSQGSVGKIDRQGKSLLHLALASKAYACADYLLSLEVVAPFRYQPDQAGNTPLLLALENQATIEPFLNKTTVNHANALGETPLLLAIRNHCPIEPLLQAGAQVNVQTKNGDTPLHLAVSQNSTAVVDQLLKDTKAGSLLETVDPDGNTALHIATIQGCREILMRLLDSATPEQINRKNKTGDSPWLLSIPSGDVTLITKFLEKGAAVHEATRSGETALYIAAALRHTSVVQLLLEKGASVDQASNCVTPLWIACQNGHESVVRLLLKKGASVDQASKDGYTPLYVTCQNGHESVVRLLLEKGASVDQASTQGLTPLLSACQNGHTPVVRLLLEKGARMDQASKDGCTPLYVACQNGHESVVRLFLKKGANVDQATTGGSTPLSVACENGHESVVRLLLESGASVVQATTDGFTPLFMACQNGHESVVRLLLESGASVDQANQDGFTPLYVACQNGHESVVRLFLKKGASVDQANKDGSTPLSMACLNGHESVVRLLLEKRASVAQARNNGITPLFMACQNGHEMVARLLLESGASVDQASNEGLTPLYMAGFNNHASVVQLLLGKGANVNQADVNGHTLLYVASGYGLETIVRLLLEYGASMNQTTKDGRTPLFMVSQNGHETTAQLLLEKGANVDQADHAGFTSLHLACIAGHLGMVRLLLKKGASVNQVNKDGYTPFHCVCKIGYEPLARLLLENGGSLNQADNNGNTPLNAATNGGHETVIRFLLDRGANVDQANNDGYSPLYMAVLKGNEPVARLLLEHRASINQADKTGATSLYAACGYGHETVVRLLLDRGANVDQVNNDGYSPLYMAVSKGNEAVARLLLERGASINQAAKTGATSLYAACAYGLETVVPLLLDRGASVDQGDNNGFTPLYMACQGGLTTVVEILLTKGADVNQVSKDGTTPLYGASLNGHVGVVDRLLEKGAKVNQARNDGWTPLMIASQNGHVKVVEILLAKGAAMVNQANNNGGTPLYAACENGHSGVVELLLAKGADVNRATNTGFPPLYVACQFGHTVVVEILLTKGADVNQVDKDGTTPLYSGSLNGHVGVVGKLLEKGAKVNQARNDGWSPLLVASQRGHVKVVETLLAQGAALNQANSGGFTPLYVSSLNGRVEVVEMLLRAGADVHQASKDGYMPLYGACQNGHEAVIRLLLGRGPIIDCISLAGFTPLFIASQNGHAGSLRILLENGANVNRACNNGVTPLWMACQNGHEAVVRLLVSVGADLVPNKRGETPFYRAVKHGKNTVAEFLLTQVPERVMTAEKAAAYQNAAVAYQLAKLYQDGGLLQKNETEAFHWYRVSAEKAELEKNSVIAYALAQLYATSGDQINSAHCQQKAADWGSAEAAFAFGWITEAQKNQIRTEEEKYDSFFMQAANLAEHYFVGKFGVQNDVRAQYWLERALDLRPDHEYMAILGAVLSHWGINTTKQRDDVDAWQRLRLFLGTGNAQLPNDSNDKKRFLLGQAYRLASDLLRYGEGIAHNHELADRYLKQAADWGDVEAQTQWGLQMLANVGQKIGFESLEKAANQGGIIGQWNLAKQALKSGNPQIGYQWLIRAAAQGHTLAKQLCALANTPIHEFAAAQQWYKDQAATSNATPHCLHAWSRVQEEMGKLEDAVECYKKTFTQGQPHLVSLKRLRSIGRKDNWTLDQEVLESLNLRKQSLPVIRWTGATFETDEKTPVSLPAPRTTMEVAEKVQVAPTHAPSPQQPEPVEEKVQVTPTHAPPTQQPEPVAEKAQVAPTHAPSTQQPEPVAEKVQVGRTDSPRQGLFSKTVNKTTKGVGQLKDYTKKKLKKL